jgi:hypothetical protein
MPIGHLGESSPLMRSAPSHVGVPPHGNGDGRASLRRGSNTVYSLLDPKYTPGLNSQNSALRYLAYSWQVTKATLLSSMFAPGSETSLSLWRCD